MKRIAKPGDSQFQIGEARYDDLVPNDGLLLKHMIENLDQTKALVDSLSDNKLLYRYAPGKWSIKEVLVHLIDMERIYTYRALRFARNDQTMLPGFDDKEYVRFSGADARSAADLLNELAATRQSTIALINGLPDDALDRQGTANGQQASVRALLYHLAGHEVHHRKIIKERYL